MTQRVNKCVVCRENLRATHTRRGAAPYIFVAYKMRRMVRNFDIRFDFMLIVTMPVIRTDEDCDAVWPSILKDNLLRDR